MTDMDNTNGMMPIRPKGVIRKKPGFWDNEIVSGIVQDVIIPTLKGLVSAAIDRMLFGETSHSRLGSLQPGRISYRNAFERRSAAPRAEYLRVRSQLRPLDDLVFETAEEAETVVNQLWARIEAYGCASVADLYDIIGQTGDYTDNRFGWTAMTLPNYNIRTINGGVRLYLPPARPLDREA